jgi:hypothetical protein
MRKIISVVMISLMLLSVVYGIDTSISVVDEDSRNFFAKIFAPGAFSITGTVEQSTGGRTEFQRGEIFSRQYTLYWDRDSTRYDVEFYFYKNDKPLVHLATKSYNYAHVKGDTAKVTINNIDTGLVPVTYCNENVVLGGRHILYGNYPECDGAYTNVLPNHIKCGNYGAPDMYISTTRPGQTVQDTTAGTFKILCSTVADPCINKKGDDAGVAAYCKLGNVVKDMYTGTQSNGQCTTTTYLYRACQTACENGQCVTQLKSNGQSCMYNGLEDNSLCVSNLCVMGICRSERNDVGKGCLNQGDCLGGLVCVKNTCASDTLPVEPGNNNPPVNSGVDGTSPDCSTDKLCWDEKTVLMKCVNGVFGEPQLCPACQVDDDCREGYVCKDKSCELDDDRVECSKDSDCSDLYRCSINECVPRDTTTPTQCVEDSDCVTGSTCEGVQCVEKISGWAKFWKSIADWFRSLFGG